MPARKILFTADDFGLSPAVNEAVERAYREGVLTHASLMVTGDAAEDAVARAHANPGLKVGLHLVLVEGRSVLPHALIPDLTDEDGRFSSEQFRLGLRYFFSRRARGQLLAEITAQFQAFAATGLELDHADAHKHMQVHPTVGRIMLEIGRKFGLERVRIPAEPPEVIQALGEETAAGERALYRWCTVLRRQAKRLHIAHEDNVFGLHWTGHMTQARVLRLLDVLPEGTSEIYFHPAAWRDETLSSLMPEYEHEAELGTLLSKEVKEKLFSLRIR